ncbi:restriction endonuclease subunit S [Nitrosopumilus sp. S4]
MEKNNLPKGWIETSLENVCSIILGQSPPSSTYNSVGEGLPFFQGKADFGELYPTTRIWCSKPKKIAEKNDLLLSVRAPVGSTNLSSEPCCIGRGLASIRPLIKQMDIKFFIYFFNLIKNNLNTIGTGTTFKAISGRQIKELKIKLPPLEEQKRIIKKIDDLFSKLKKIKTLIKHTQNQLKQYEQSLLNNTLQSLTFDYESKKLNDICIKITDGTHFTPEYTATGIPFISVKDIQNEKINFDNCKYVSKKTHDTLIKRCKPEYGDLLITKSGTIGRMALVDTKIPFSLFVSVALIKPKKTINRKYLKYIFHNYFNHLDISQQIKGGVIKNFHLEDIREVMIPIPPNDKQQKIVVELEQSFSYIKNIENIIHQMLLQVDLLYSTILKQAFEGKLISQDLNDESAEILLEKIASVKLNKN